MGTTYTPSQGRAEPLRSRHSRTQPQVKGKLPHHRRDPPFRRGALKGQTIRRFGGDEDTLGLSLSLISGSDPEVRHFPTAEQELAAIVAHMQAMSEQDKAQGICLVARTNDLVDDYERKLNEAGLATSRIKRREAEDARIGGIRLATMHRVKGLEFDHMILAAVNEGLVPHQMLAETEDETIRRQQEQAELALLYVAATRARKTVLVTSYGKPSEFLKT